MAEKSLQMIDGAYAPDPSERPGIVQAYKVKYAYYFLSGLIMLMGFLVIYTLRDLTKEGIPLWNLYVDQTIFNIYALFIVITGMAMRARAGTCVVCGHYRFPLLGQGYCERCGAHLFNHQTFLKQKVAKAEKERNPGELMLEMASRGDVDAVHNLIGKGVDVNVQDKYGVTPLMNAAMSGRMDVLNLLLMAGADPAKRNNYGLDALMLAVDKGRLDTSKRLLDYGVNPTQKTPDGRSALDIARNKKNEELIQLISGHPGSVGA